MCIRNSDIHVPERSKSKESPLFMSVVPAGFPSPADDYVERKLDLNTCLIRHPAATFFVRVSGDSMTGAGIHSGDLLIVDRALEPVDGGVVIACVDGELMVKRIRKRDGKLFLVPDNREYDPIEITEDMDLTVWGVATTVIHNL
ncbi:LexA family protein [Candidatus Latescibacterota bacterium]